MTTINQNSAATVVSPAHNQEVASTIGRFQEARFLQYKLHPKLIARFLQIRKRLSLL